MAFEQQVSAQTDPPGSGRAAIREKKRIRNGDKTRYLDSLSLVAFLATLVGNGGGRFGPGALCGPQEPMRKTLHVAICERGEYTEEKSKRGGCI